VRVGTSRRRNRQDHRGLCRQAGPRARHLSGLPRGRPRVAAPWNCSARRDDGPSPAARRAGHCGPPGVRTRRTRTPGCGRPERAWGPGPWRKTCNGVGPCHTNRCHSDKGRTPPPAGTAEALSELADQASGRGIGAAPRDDVSAGSLVAGHARYRPLTPASREMVGNAEERKTWAWPAQTVGPEMAA